MSYLTNVYWKDKKNEITQFVTMMNTPYFLYSDIKHIISKGDFIKLTADNFVVAVDKDRSSRITKWRLSYYGKQVRSKMDETL